jgi:hypothetical protein
MEESPDELVFVYPEAFKPEMYDKSHLVFRPVNSLYEAIEFCIKSYYLQKNPTSSSQIRSTQYYIPIPEDEVESFIDYWKPPTPTTKYKVHILVAGSSTIAMNMGDFITIEDVDNVDKINNTYRMMDRIKKTANVLVDPPTSSE